MTAACGEFVAPGPLRQLLVRGVALQLLQQLCGLNAFLYYG